MAAVTEQVQGHRLLDMQHRQVAFIRRLRETTRKVMNESPPRSHAPAGAARSPAALSSGWKSAEGEGSTAAGSRADAEEMEVDDGMLEFVSFCQRRHTLA